ncbi:MAG: PPOX class F420-dependent oxidoreductase [Solirubrobacterales bacterium]|nr:PPOX class F420-dependent oxidoreductase [Solirubrobacterales bacterium]
MADFTDDVRELFEQANYVHVATLMPDGSPQSVAVWAGLEGERVVFFTQAGAQKARNLDRDPRVALSVTDHDNPYRTARIRGRVVERRNGEAADAIMDQLSLRYTGEPFPMRGPNTVAYVIKTEKVSFTSLPFEHRPPGPA